ncbi:hypothetical protein H359_0333 [Chlamydia ibidis 10-1398/6]|uniref:Uncharacterized protein n=1 Tax=Chlamydia ibidis 10-1398/6 TaxID=1046581 RepID=A0ABP2XEL2_9CHLA|nr:hypothetical protein [Chlamydia ibidis]EQM62933.1 hypothetical protein H359_0333 [Chlamydia ibidis 10-1398/6]
MSSINPYSSSHSPSPLNPENNQQPDGVKKTSGSENGGIRASGKAGEKQAAAKVGDAARRAMSNKSVSTPPAPPAPKLPSAFQQVKGGGDNKGLHDNLIKELQSKFAGKDTDYGSKETQGQSSASATRGSVSTPPAPPAPKLPSASQQVKGGGDNKGLHDNLMKELQAKFAGKDTDYGSKETQGQSSASATRGSVSTPPAPPAPKLPSASQKVKGGGDNKGLHDNLMKELQAKFAGKDTDYGSKETQGQAESTKTPKQTSQRNSRTESGNNKTGGLQSSLINELKNKIKRNRG